MTPFSPPTKMPPFPIVSREHVANAQKENERARRAGRRAIYSLRRTLPLHCFEQRLEELLSFVGAAEIDEVVLKIDSEEWSQGIPSIEWAAAYAEKLAVARDAILDMGALFSLNPWVSIGHNSRGRDLRHKFPDFTWMVGHDGSTSKTVACPLCKNWQAHTVALWKIYAGLGPHVLWIEDDIRMFNHSPLRFGCFCSLHMQAFSEKAGRKVGRGELLAAITEPGEPHPWRALWLETLRQGVEEVCGLIERAVHSVSPETRLGLMSSGVEYHSLDGRDWPRLREILGGQEKKTVHSRPTLGNYRETSLTGLYTCAAQIKRTRHLFPGCVEQTEIENFPFSAYTKSAIFTWLQAAVSLSHGCHGLTMNLFDHMGTPIEYVHEALGPMLAGRRPFLEALASAHSSRGVFRGVGVFCDGWDAGKRRLRNGEGYSDLQQLHFRWEAALNAMGFPTTYGPSSVVACDGQRIASLDDDGLLNLLKRGLLLDLESAQVLIRRGFGRHLGIEIEGLGILNGEVPTPAEELVEEEKREDRYMTFTMLALNGDAEFARVRPLPGSVIHSYLVNEKRERISPFLIAHENNLGGRVAVLPIRLGNLEDRYLLSPQRQRQMKALLEWLGKGPLEAEVGGGVYPLSYRLDLSDRTLLGVFNLSHDDWPHVEWSLRTGGRCYKAVRVLDSNGSWKSFGGECVVNRETLSLFSSSALSLRDPLILKIEWEQESLNLYSDV